MQFICRKESSTEIKINELLKKFHMTMRLSTFGEINPYIGCVGAAFGIIAIAGIFFRQLIKHLTLLNFVLPFSLIAFFCIAFSLGMKFMNYKRCVLENFYNDREELIRPFFRSVVINAISKIRSDDNIKIEILLDEVDPSFNLRFNMNM